MCYLLILFYIYIYISNFQVLFIKIYLSIANHPEFFTSVYDSLKTVILHLISYTDVCLTNILL